MTAIATAEMTTGAVTSKDGTRIGYLRTGQGPAVVLLHGSNESARSHTGLALGLADRFTVYLPDRRGRGMSGPHRPDHGIHTEVEDLGAVLAASGAQRVFGVSIGALIALETARTRPDIRQIAAYEPALLMDVTRYTGWVTRFDREMAEGRVAAALITSMYGLDLAPPAFKLMGAGWPSSSPTGPWTARTGRPARAPSPSANSPTPCATRGCCSPRRPGPSEPSPRWPPTSSCSAAR